MSISSRSIARNSSTVEDVVDSVRLGERRAAGRLITRIESQDPSALDVLARLYADTGSACVVGFTGPPGAGKSTLVDELLAVVRSAGETVGVVAVDPNSPFSGGAILGDRIRMMRHSSDTGIFIRSMGARGSLGGLARATSGTVRVLDAMKFDYVMVETVGVGQSELDVAGLADTTVVIIPPGLGDGVQAIKAGIMEIADIFVVNKADHPQANRTIADIKDLLHMELEPRAWTPPIVSTIATQGVGLQDLWMRIQQHGDYLTASGELVTRRRERLKAELVDMMWQQLRTELLEPAAETEHFNAVLDEVVTRKLDPYTAARHLDPRTFARPE